MRINRMYQDFRNPSPKSLAAVSTVCLYLLLGASYLAADEVTKWNGIAGNASFTSSAAPPTMMARVPSVARGTPPETGASTKRTPRSRAAAATRRDTAGSMVDMSTQSVPLRAAASTPPSPV